MSLSRSPPGSSRSNANAFVMPSNASRSSMRRHHRVVIGDDGYGDARDQTKLWYPDVNRACGLHGCLSRQVQR